MWTKPTKKVVLGIVVAFGMCLVSFSTSMAIGGEKFFVQREFNVPADRLESILPDFVKSLGHDVASQATPGCFLTSYKYVQEDRFVEEERVRTDRHNFEVVEFLKKVAFPYIAYPPHCSVWQRAAHRYKVYIEDTSANSSRVSVHAHVIGWEKCFSWHTFRSNGTLEGEFLDQFTKFIEEKSQ